MANHAKRIQPRVLLAEDDRRFRRALRLALENTGFMVVEVASGGEALMALETQTIHVVVLGLCLPDAREGAVLDHLRELERREGCRCAWVVTFTPDMVDVIRQYGPVGNHALPRPFYPRYLARMLETFLSAEDRLQEFDQE